MELEVWKPIPGYEGIYDASNLGNVRSAPGKTTTDKRGTRLWKTRVLKQKSNTGRGDRIVTLWKDGSPRCWLVSRLVASAWIGQPSKDMTVNHINGNPLDNRPENLEWVTRGDNIRHGFRTGLYAARQKKVTLIAENGREYSFDSMAAASSFVGKNHGYVSWLAKHGRASLFSADGIKYTIKGVGA